MVKAGHSGLATLLATVSIIAGMIYIRFIRDCLNQYACFCDSENYVQLDIENVQALLDSAHGSDWHKGEVVVDEEAYETLRREFENEIEED